MDSVPLILAPMRGITVRAFRETFAGAIREYGFKEAVAPFIPANPGLRISDRLFSDLAPFPAGSVPTEGSVPTRCFVIPQIIGKDPKSLRIMIRALKERGFARVDLNAGCPFPMIRRRGRGSGLLSTPDLLERMIEAGCEEMGPGAFSLKTRLGEKNPDDLFKLMPRINRYPLAMLTVHARTAVQMYGGAPDFVEFGRILEVSENPVVYNGDAEGSVPLSPAGSVPTEGSVPMWGGKVAGVMVGRGFLRSLGRREDAVGLLAAYVDRLCGELCGDRPVLGRVKELLTYWTQGSPRWKSLWPAVKICRTVGELRAVAFGNGGRALA